VALNDTFFATIDSEAKAYLLGWIASDGSITPGSITMYVHPKDASIVGTWRDILGGAVPEKRVRNLVGITLNSQQLVRDVCRWLDIKPGKNPASVAFPELASDELRWAFLRGFFDGDGSVSTPVQTRSLRCDITTGSERFRDAVRAWCPIRAYYSGDKIEWAGNNALDFLGRLYEGASFRLERKYRLYQDWCTWVPSLSGWGAHGRSLQLRWVKADPLAVAPRKARVSDSGYDLTVIKKVKTVGRVELYDTGIKIQPDYGWYFDVVARSSLTKTGYIIGNSVGIIDRTYVGTVLIPLIKIDADAPELALPATVAQLIPRPIVHAEVVEVDAFDETERGAGGFGSTGFAR
jgi:deoxyuridine 5'-triphosphate nucleotidohydrolase